MNRNSGGACSDPEEQSERGQNNIVAIVILLGVVAIGAFAIFAVSGTVIDGLQSQMGGEQLESTMASIDHDLMTAATTGDVRNLPAGGYDDLRVSDDGSIAVAWYDDPANRTFTSENTSQLGAIELDYGGQTLVHQGGGIWGPNGADVITLQTPPITFGDNGELDVDVMQIDSSVDDASPSQIYGNASAGASTTDRLTDVMESQDGHHFAIQIESEYADGWYNHLSDETEPHASWEVTKVDDETVIVASKWVGEPSQSENLLINTDGLTPHSSGSSHEDAVGSDYIKHGEAPGGSVNFNLDSVVSNLGNESDIEATLTIQNESFSEERSIRSDNSVSENDTISTDDSSDWNKSASNLWFNSSELTPAAEYEYIIEAEHVKTGDTVQIERPFTSLAEGVHYEVSDHGTEQSDEQTNISTTIANLGDESPGDGQDVTLDIQPEADWGPITETEPVDDLSPAERESLRWKLETAQWPNGNYEYEITTEDDTETGEFDIIDGLGGFVIFEDHGLVGGNVILEDDDVEIEADILNTDQSADTQDIDIELFDNDSTLVGSSSESVPIDGSEKENVNLAVEDDEHDLEAGNVYEYDIQTEDHELAERGTFLVVEDAPEMMVTDAEIDESVKPGESVSIEATVKNEGGNGTQFVFIEDFDDNIVASEEITLDEEEETTVELEWPSVSIPDPADETTVNVATDGDSESVDLDIDGLLEVNNLEITEKDVLEAELVGEGPTAISFDGDDSVDSTVTADELDGPGGSDKDEMTLAAWVKPDADGSGEQVVWYGHNNDENDGNDRWELTYDHDSERFAWRNHGDDSAHLEADTTSESGEWHFVTWWYQKDDGEQRIYIDGEEAGSADNNGYPLRSSENTMLLGAAGEGSSYDSFEGKVAHVTLWEMALQGQGQIPETPDDVGKASGNKLLSWEIDEGSGGTLKDSAEDNDGQIDGAEWVGDVIGQTLDVTVEAELEAVGGDADQTVTLEGFDDEPVDSSDVFVSADETKTVELEYTTDSGAITDYVTVRTDDDEMDEVVVVERDGPVCELVEESERDEDGYLLIENVDQLQCIDTAEPHDLHSSWQDSLSDDYRLANDIAAQGTEYWNEGDGFEPIGQQDGGQGGTPFSGDFDGQAHTIEGLSIDRYDEPFVGLFAITAEFQGQSNLGEGVTIENVQLEEVDVRGESVVGGLVGGAGGTIMNTSVSGEVESQYQQVGGLVGHGHDADLDNQLVSTATVTGTTPAAEDNNHPWNNDNNNPNLGIGGIVGGTGFETDVSTAYSTATVEGNSAVGGIIGWTSDFSSTNKQMYWAGGEAERIDPYNVVNRGPLDPQEAGAIAGRMEMGEDTFEESVYSEESVVSIGEQVADADDISLSDEDMRGPAVLPDDKDDEFYEQYPGVTRDDAEGTMKNLDWDIWEPVYEVDTETGEIINEGYPQFSWQAEADGSFEVFIDDATNVTAGETVEVDVTVNSRYTDDEPVTQVISLADPDGDTVYTKAVTLEGGESEQITLNWQTSPDMGGSDTIEEEITVSSEDIGDTTMVSIDPPEFSPGDAGIDPGASPTESELVGDGGDGSAGVGINVDISAVEIE